MKQIINKLYSRIKLYKKSSFNSTRKKKKMCRVKIISLRKTEPNVLYLSKAFFGIFIILVGLGCFVILLHNILYDVPVIQFRQRTPNRIRTPSKNENNNF